MKKILLVMLMIVGASVHARAQCSVSSPCFDLSWSNASMAATVATSAAGVETAGPGTAAVYRCIGAAGVCSAASLAASGCSSGTCVAGSPWSILSNTIAQVAPAATYRDPAIGYNETLNYAVTDTWTGAQGGVASSYSGIFQYAVGTAPSAAPATPGTPTGVLVTSGS
jgi:hypothetical protein